jgi:hypothetical protein
LLACGVGLRGRRTNATDIFLGANPHLPEGARDGGAPGFLKGSLSGSFPTSTSKVTGHLCCRLGPVRNRLGSLIARNCSGFHRQDSSRPSSQCWQNSRSPLASQSLSRTIGCHLFWRRRPASLIDGIDNTIANLRHRIAKKCLAVFRTEPLIAKVWRQSIVYEHTSGSQRLPDQIAERISGCVGNRRRTFLSASADIATNATQ